VTGGYVEVDAGGETPGFAVSGGHPVRRKRV
jgi:hypothetical protein